MPSARPSRKKCSTPKPPGSILSVIAGGISLLNQDSVMTRTSSTCSLMISQINGPLLTADHALSVPTRIEDFCLYGAGPGFGSMPASSSSAVINTDPRVVDAKLYCLNCTLQEGGPGLLSMSPDSSRRNATTADERERQRRGRKGRPVRDHNKIPVM